MAATNGVVLGVYNGVSLAAAFANPLSNDLLQIFNLQGKKCIAKVSSTGVVTLNPTSQTNDTILGEYNASNATNTLAAIFASAFTNPSGLDVFQVFSEVAAPVVSGSGGMVLIGRLNNAGVYSTT